ncbi:hypothetical protein, partial [Lactococcus ileimucosae]|uniref:hypothetical protein n=1 Tax=Lactococcus ileimucosae TaxID=2941329 RepID=UPI003517B7FC
MKGALYDCFLFCSRDIFYKDYEKQLYYAGNTVILMVSKVRSDKHIKSGIRFSHQTLISFDLFFFYTIDSESKRNI